MGDTDRHLCTDISCIHFWGIRCAYIFECEGVDSKATMDRIWVKEATWRCDSEYRKPRSITQAEPEYKRRESWEEKHHLQPGLVATHLHSARQRNLDIVLTHCRKKNNWHCMCWPPAQSLVNLSHHSMDPLHVDEWSICAPTKTSVLASSHWVVLKELQWNPLSHLVSDRRLSQRQSHHDQSIFLPTVDVPSYTCYVWVSDTTCSALTTNFAPSMSFVLTLCKTWQSCNLLWELAVWNLDISCTLTHTQGDTRINLTKPKSIALTVCCVFACSPIKIQCSPLKRTSEITTTRL